MLDTARWETSQDGSTWEHDFDLTYRKATEPVPAARHSVQRQNGWPAGSA